MTKPKKSTSTKFMAKAVARIKAPAKQAKPAARKQEAKPASTKPQKPAPSAKSKSAPPAPAGPAYQILGLPSSCSILAIRGSAAEFVKGRTVHWALGDGGSPSHEGSTIAQATGDAWFRILTNYLFDDAIPPSIGAVERLVLFSYEDTSCGSLIAVYEQGKPVHAIEWGFDYARSGEVAAGSGEPPHGASGFVIHSGRELIKYRGPLAKAVAVGSDTNAIISALCAAIGIRVVGDEYFGGGARPSAKRFDYFGDIDL